MAVLTVEHERKRRLELWADLQKQDLVARATPEDLRQRGIYGGAQGVWVDKQAKLLARMAASPSAYFTREGTIQMIFLMTA
jgi:hypothetical protein